MTLRASLGSEQWDLLGSGLRHLGMMLHPLISSFLSLGMGDEGIPQYSQRDHNNDQHTHHGHGRSMQNRFSHGLFP
jgi:hypothetical protein